MAEKKLEEIELGLGEIVLLILFGVTFFSVWKKWYKLRPVVLAFSVFLLGFRLNSSINLGDFASLISGNFSSFQERLFWFLLIIGTFLLILIVGRNLYCIWLCPFGAIQEGINKSLGLVKFQIFRKFLVHANRIRLILIWIAFIIAFLFVNPSIAGYELFLLLAYLP